MPPRPIKGPAALEKARRRAANSFKALKEAREQRQHALDKASLTVQDAILQPSKAEPIVIKATSSTATILRGNVASYASRIPTLTAAKASQNSTPLAKAQIPKLTVRPPVRPPIPVSRRFQRILERTTRQINVPSARSRSRFHGYAGRPTISDLQSLLGLPGSARAGQGPVPNSVLISIDTETERQGLLNQVVEIGVSVLRLKDLAGVEPGSHAQAWMAKMEHQHMVIDVTQRPRTRMRGSLFGSSHFVDAAVARRMLKAILQACADGRPLPKSPYSVDTEVDEKLSDPAARTEPQADLWVVGQSIDGDLRALAGRPIQLDISKPAVLGGVTIWSVIDTLPFSQHAISLGARIGSSKLGRVVRFLGADAAYHDPVKPTIVGWHNASNDAAYTMMALLLYAVRWSEIIAPVPTPVTKKSVQWFGARIIGAARGAARGEARKVTQSAESRQDHVAASQTQRRSAILMAAVGGIAGLSILASAFNVDG